MGAAQNGANDNDFSDGEGLNEEDQSFGAEFAHAHGELEIEEQKIGRDGAGDNDEFSEFHYDFENQGNNDERQRQRN